MSLESSGAGDLRCKNPNVLGYFEIHNKLRINENAWCFKPALPLWLALEAGDEGDVLSLAAVLCAAICALRVSFSLQAVPPLGLRGRWKPLSTCLTRRASSPPQKRRGRTPCGHNSDPGLLSGTRPFSQVGPVCPQLPSLSSPPIRLFRGTSPALTRELLQNRRCWAGLLASTAWPAPEPRRYRAGQWPLEP